ncbi:hypothetical protein [Lutibacter sp.]
MRKILILFLFLTTINFYSQNNIEYTFGKLTNEDLNLKKYVLDTTANAVVLLDLGNTVFLKRNGKTIISSKYYQKIKIFNTEGFKYATFIIPLYNNGTTTEKVIGIKAITHNNLDKTHLDKKHIYKERINEKRQEVRFTLPNLKKGSIIEVEYTIETPFIYNLIGWDFQSDIPKIFSQYKASIPGNFVYNRTLNGYLKLKTNDAVVKKNCFVVSEFERAASCEVVTYAMENIPAFIEEEYITNKDNFISKIKFELSEIQQIRGNTRNFTTTWKAVDKKFKNDKDIGGQLRKTKFFEDKLPAEIKNIDTDLEKAKAIFTYIQNHFTWNNKTGIFGSVNLKKAFEAEIGNVGEINISLINALKLVGLNTELVLISTRNNGFPTKLHPVISDFNYIIAKVNINNKSYLLDATSKLTPFGLLPYRCLNGYGRVMDFKNESYWFNIIPVKNSKTQLTASLKLNTDGTITGKLRKASFGYDALFRRNNILNKSEEDLIAEFETKFNTLEVTNYTTLPVIEINKPVIETIEFIIEKEDNFAKLYLNPFLSEQIKVNPFKQENRLYPVDFGYQRKYIVYFSLEIPKNYSVESFPESKAIALPDNKGSFILKIKKIEDSKITLNSTIKINKPVFYNNEYAFLKMFYNQIINSQKTPIVLKKTSNTHN